MKKMKDRRRGQRDVEAGSEGEGDGGRKIGR
jgi:hypothetical protein